MQLERPLIIIDTETTGTNRESDRIIEIGLERWVSEGFDVSWRTLINPGIPISSRITKITGIRDAQVTGCKHCGRMEVEHPYELMFEEACPTFEPWPKFGNIAKALAARLTDVDFAGQNVRFDLEIMWHEFRRHKVVWNYESACVIDSKRLEELLFPRNLSALYKRRLGRELEGAHSALVDVRASREVIEDQLDDKHSDVKLPRNVRKLHETQWAGWVTACGRIRLNHDGVAWIGFGKHKGPLRSVPIDYLDWMLKNMPMQDDMRRVILDAKLGKFPEAK